MEGVRLSSKDSTGRMSRLPIALLATLVLLACQREPSVSEPRSGPDSAGSAAQVDDCPRTWVWLKDPAEVDRHRGIDVPESNFRILGCRDVLDSLSKADLARLAHELDALVDADRSKFERDWQGEGFRHQVTSRLNEILGRPAVEDWSADLWKMAY